MKRILFSLLLLAAATPAFAVRTVLVVDEVIRMSKAGVGDDEIIAYLEKAEPFDVAGDDVIAMTDARVSRDVIKAVIDESTSRMGTERRRNELDVDRSQRRARVYFYYDPFWIGSRYGYGYRGYYGGFYGGYYGGYYPRYYGRRFRRH